MPAMYLKQIWNLINKSVAAWIDDYAPSMGAALAYYTLFSMAPLLLIVIAVAGLVFVAEAARGEIVVLLNNDVTVTSDDWLNAMVAQAMRPQVGVVGAHLRYPDGRTQHGGVILGVGLEPRVAGHLYVGATAEDPGYFHHLKLARNLSAVTGACLALRKTVFVAVGGLEAENLAVAFNDVDLCLKVRALGLQIIWTPLAQMVHLESASRGSDLAAQHRDRFRSESEWMRTRWGMLLDNDPFYGPNFDHLTADYRLAFPPNRVSSLPPPSR